MPTRPRHRRFGPKHARLSAATNSRSSDVGTPVPLLGDTCLRDRAGACTFSFAGSGGRHDSAAGTRRKWLAFSGLLNGEHSEWTHVGGARSEYGGGRLGTRLTDVDPRVCLHGPHLHLHLRADMPAPTAPTTASAPASAPRAGKPAATAAAHPSPLPVRMSRGAASTARQSSRFESVGEGALHEATGRTPRRHRPGDSDDSDASRGSTVRDDEHQADGPSGPADRVEVQTPARDAPPEGDVQRRVQFAKTLIEHYYRNLLFVSRAAEQRKSRLEERLGRLRITDATGRCCVASMSAARPVAQARDVAQRPGGARAGGARPDGARRVGIVRVSPAVHFSGRRVPLPGDGVFARRRSDAAAHPARHPQRGERPLLCGRDHHRHRPGASAGVHAPRHQARQHPHRPRGTHPPVRLWAGRGLRAASARHGAVARAGRPHHAHGDRSGGRVRQGVRLVEPGRHPVRDAVRLSGVLRGRRSGDVPQDPQLAHYAAVPVRGQTVVAGARSDLEAAARAGEPAGRPRRHRRVQAAPVLCGRGLEPVAGAQTAVRARVAQSDRYAVFRQV
eukprot:ctg_681.g358